jgi:hypothetical protein
MSKGQNGRSTRLRVSLENNNSRAFLTIDPYSLFLGLLPARRDRSSKAKC